MAEERITWIPVKGINMDDPPIRVRPDECTEARNMLFERGVARTRPHAVRDTYTFWPAASVTGYRFAKSAIAANGPDSVVLNLDSGSGFGIGAGPQAVTLTGPTLANIGSYEYDNITVVNGVFLIGNDTTTGILRYDPADVAGVYTALGGPAGYRYVTSLFSRAIGLWGGGGALSGRRVAWSVAGDETTWTGAGSGQSVLAETTDEITGGKTLQNVLVVLRSMGLTLGYPTGSGTAPIRFETLIREGSEGCPWPSTVAGHGNELFWVGHDDAYRMDLNLQPKPIARGIRKELLFWLARGVLFRGVTVRMDYGMPSGGAVTQSGNEICDPVPRLRYHLVPIMRVGQTTFPTNRSIPHYSYDAAEGTWGRHTYSFTPRGGCENFNLSTRSTVSGLSWNLTIFIDGTTQDVVRWGENASGAGEALDQPASITSGVFTVGDPTLEYKCQRVQIIWARDGSHGTSEPDPQGVTVLVTCQQEHRKVGKSATVDLFQVGEGSEAWQSTWIDLGGEPVGQFFQIQIDIPATLKMQIAQVQAFLFPAGKSKAGGFKQA